MTDEVDIIQSPAIVTKLHVQDRNLTRDTGSKKGWRKLSPLERAYENGQLGGDGQMPKARRDAGMEYGEMFRLSQSSGRDSTDLDRVSGAGQGLAFAEKQGIALRQIASIDSHMGRRDRLIVRMVCGQEFFPSEAVAAACGSDSAKRTMPRFREALDALIEAMETARRSGYSKFNLGGCE